jgi:hypothetical protein
VLYVTINSASRPYKEMNSEGKGFGNRLSWPKRDTIPEFSWRG